MSENITFPETTYASGQNVTLPTSPVMRKVKELGIPEFFHYVNVVRPGVYSFILHYNVFRNNWTSIQFTCCRGFRKKWHGEDTCRRVCHLFMYNYGQLNSKSFGPTTNVTKMSINHTHTFDKFDKEETIV